jgi:hypothetical protein
MRYLQVPIVPFTDATGKQYSIHDFREIPSYSIARTMNRSAEEAFDEIASRQYVYGDGGERNANQLYEANIVAIVEAGWDLSKISSIKVPS